MTTTPLAPVSAIDLLIPDGVSFEQEDWRPSQDYPEVTRHELRQQGAVLVELVTPPYGRGAPYERRAQIVALHPAIARAELVFEGPSSAPTHFDLGTQRIVSDQEMVRRSCACVLDAREPTAWLSLLAALSSVGPGLYPSLAPRAFSAEELCAQPLVERGPSRESSARFDAPSNVPPLTATPWIAALFGQTAPPAIPHYGVSRVVEGEQASFCCWIAEETAALLSVTVWYDPRKAQPRSALVVAQLPRAVTIAAVDRAVATLRDVLDPR